MTAASPGPCDAGVAERTAPAPAGTAHPVATLVTCVLGSSVAFIDGSVVNVALPTMQGAFGADASGAQWLVNAYLLPLGALVLIGGAAADRYGRRRTFSAGLVLFALASAGCAAAPGLGTLLAARALQGIGAAFLMPASLAILGAAFAGEGRGRAIGTWAAAGAVAGALGPVLGGWLVDAVGWRAIFLVNLPIAAVALVLARTSVAESRGGANARDPLDLAGAGLATLGLAAVTWGLTVLPERGPGAATLGALGLGALALLGFVVNEARRGAAAMVPLSLFASRRFVGVTLLTLLLYAALAGLLVLLPYVLIRVGHYPGTAAGAAMLPISVAMGLGSRWAGRSAERTGPRLPLTAGPILVAVSFLLLTRLDPLAPYLTTLLPAMACMGIGLTVSVAPLTATAIAAVDAGHAGLASGVNNATARIAGMVATALLGLVLVRAGSDDALLAAFQSAALAGAALCLLAAASAAWLIGGGRGLATGGDDMPEPRKLARSSTA